MQEEIVDKSIDIAAQVTSLTLSQILKALDAISKNLENKSDKSDISKDAAEPELKHGKQTLKQLHKHNDGLSTIDLTDPNLRELHKSMKKADIDFSCVKDGKGKYTLFFKGKNADEMTSAFKRYTQKVTQIADKKAIRQELREAKAAAKALDKGRNKVKNRSKGERDI